MKVTDILDRMKSPDQCSVCKQYYGHHALECTTLTLEQIRSIAIESRETRSSELKRSHSQWLRQRHDIQFWQGKYQTVKHENNKLRNKLYAKKKISPATHVEGSGLAGMESKGKPIQFDQSLESKPTTNPE